VYSLHFTLSMLQGGAACCGAAWCSVLQHGAAWCRVLQGGAVCFQDNGSVVQGVAILCSALQSVERPCLCIHTFRCVEIQICISNFRHNSVKIADRCSHQKKSSFLGGGGTTYPQYDHVWVIFQGWSQICRSNYRRNPVEIAVPCRFGTSHEEFIYVT